MWLINKLIDALLRILLLVQGKGWGTSTTEQEVRLILKINPLPQIVVDVGGNIGNWSAVLLRHSKPKQVYIFEPAKKNLDSLTRRFENRPDVTVIPKALSSEDGFVSLFANESGSELASLHQRRLDHFGLSFNVIEKIETMSVRRFLSVFASHKSISLNWISKGMNWRYSKRFLMIFGTKSG